MSVSSINILMTGGGAPGAPGILKCLQANPVFYIVMADANADAVGRWLHAEFEIIPFANDNNFIDTLLSICKKRNIHVVVPLVTKELIPLSLHKQEFEMAGTKVLVSDISALEIANDKSQLYQFLEWRVIEVPQYRVVETVEQFKQALDELGFPLKPVCFKPSVSNGSRGFRIISDHVNDLKWLFNEKPDSTYMSYADAVRILSSGKFPELLISEYLPGEEYSVDCLANHGEPVMIVPRLRKKMINGISVQGELINEPNIINYCTKIIKSLKLHGNIGIQVKASAEGKFLVLEINPRVQGTIVAAFGAGVNLPALAIKQELGIPIDPQEMKINWGTKFTRYWNEVFY